MAKAKGKFRRERKLFEITFEDPDLEGFEVTMKGVSLGKFVEITALASALEAPGGRTTENIEKQFTLLADHLVDWNYSDDDGDQPASYDGLKQMDFADVMKLMYGWMSALATVPKASNDDSPSGGTSEEVSLGLANSSLAQAS
jgi:hypothetical protein